jgi:polyferredoxin
VQVCPTGIDIRDGLQNECIGCAACIDVCDDVMGKMGYPKGLIRYATDNGVRHGWGRRQMLARVWRPRVWIYGALLLVVGSVFVAGLALRAGHTVDVLRDRGALARVVDAGWIENAYRVQVGNRSGEPQRYRLTARGLEGLVLEGEAEIEVAPYAIAPAVLRLRLPPEAAQSLAPGAHPIDWVVERLGTDGGEAVRSASTFYVPR